MSEYIQHLVCPEIPHPEALLDCVSGHHFAIKVIDLNKVRILQDEVLEQSFAFSTPRLQILQTNGPALHAPKMISILHTDDEDAVVDSILKDGPHCLLLVFVDNHRLLGYAIVGKADPVLCPRQDIVL